MGRTPLLVISIFCFICLNNQFLSGQIQSKIFDKYAGIHSVYLSNNQENEVIKNNPVISLDQQTNWFINFDDLDLNYKNYFLRIVHCDKNWNSSQLNEIEYLQDFNDLPVREYKNSFGTKVPYNHYQITLPKAKLAGNYVAVLCNNRSKQDTVFAIRYSLLQNSTSIFSKITFANQNEFRKTHQNIQLAFKYNDQLIINDESNLKVVIRRLNENDNLIPKLPKPIHSVQDKTFMYQFFGTEGLILGGNEYRFIDLRSSQQKLSFVYSMNQQDVITQIKTYPESPQGNFSYTNRNDLNGSFIISNYENPSNNLYADYVQCVFQLKSREVNEGDVFLKGSFLQMKNKEFSKMTYNFENGFYEKQVLLKQGIYNYKFGGNKLVDDFLEGNYSQTENEYEVLIYFQQPGTRYDALIGHQLVRFP